MSDPKPTRSQGDLAEMLEMLLDKGVVINADIAVSVGDTELLGIELRAAVASFETAAKYGLEFPAGTNMDRVQTAAGISPDTPEGVNIQSEANQTDDTDSVEEKSVSASNASSESK